MRWINKDNKPFRYNGKLVVRRKMIFNTVFGCFEVFEAVGGKCFYRHPFIKSNYVNPITGYDNGLGDWFGKSKIQCKNIKDGIAICEKVMAKLKHVVNQY